MKIGDLFIKLGLQKGEFDKGIDDAKRKTSAFGDGMKKIGGMIAGVFAVGQVVSYVRESMKLAAETENVRKAFIRLGGGAYFNDLNNAVRGTLSQVDLMKNTIQATNFGIPIKDLANLFKFATERAAQTGQSVEYLTQSIVMGIGRKSVLILDNLGISAVQLREKLKKVGEEAATVGDVAEAIGEIAQEQFKRMGEQATTTAQKLDDVKGSWVDIKVAIGDAINQSDIFTGGIKILGDYLNVFSAQTANAMTNAGGRVKKFMATMPESIADQKTAIKAELERINQEVLKEQGKLSKFAFLTIGGIRAQKDTKQEINTLKNQAIELVGIFDQLKMKSEPVELMQRISDLELLISMEKKLASQKNISAIEALNHSDQIKKAEEELKKLREFVGIPDPKESVRYKTLEEIKKKQLDLNELTKNSIAYYQAEIELLQLKQKLMSDPLLIEQSKTEIRIKEDRLDQLTKELKLTEKIKLSNKDISEIFTTGIKTDTSRSKGEQKNGLIISDAMQKRMWNSQGFAEKAEKDAKQVSDYYDNINDEIATGIGDIINTIGSGFGEMIGTGDWDWGNFGSSILETVGGFLQQLGALFLAYGIANLAFVKALMAGPTPMGAGLAIAAGVGLIAAGAAVSSFASKGMSGGASAAPAASGYSNYSASSGAAVLSGNVVFELEGTKLRGALNNTDRRNALIR